MILPAMKITSGSEKDNKDSCRIQRKLAAFITTFMVVSIEAIMIR